jgi:hypothetical protein
MIGCTYLGIAAICSLPENLNKTIKNHFRLAWQKLQLMAGFISQWLSRLECSFPALFPPSKQGCQMVCFKTKNPNLGKIWKALGIFYDHLVNFVFIWYIFPVLVSCTKKNLATLLPSPCFLCQFVLVVLVR